MAKMSNSEEEIEPLITRDSAREQHKQVYGSTLAFSVTTKSTSAPETRSYKKLWWSLAVFSLCCFNQTALWNAWTPIANAVQIAIGWDISKIATALVVQDVSIIFWGLPMKYLVKLNGLRVAVSLCAWLSVAAISMWNFAVAQEQFGLVIIGAIFNGMAGSITIATLPVLCLTWFPVNQRVSAATISYFGSALGAGASFITGPYLSGPNITEWHIHNKANLTAGFTKDLRTGIQETMCFNGGVSVLCLLCVLSYYPARPFRSASIPSGADSVDYVVGIRNLLKNHNVWLIIAAFVIPVGFYYSWISMVSVNFRTLGVSQVTAGWIGFASILANFLFFSLLSKFIDLFRRRLKVFLVLSATLSITSTAVLACIQEGLINVPEAIITGVLCALVVAIGLLLHGAAPVYFKLGSEIACPVPSQLTNFCFIILICFSKMVYLIIFLNPIPSKDTKWMTWTLLGSSALSLLTLPLLRGSHNRLGIDAENERTTGTVQPDTV